MFFEVLAMFENSIRAKQTKFGLIRQHDIAVMTTATREIFVVHFTELYDGAKNQFHYDFFCPATNVIGGQELSWEEFEKTVTKLDVFGALDRNKLRWNDFVKQYQYYELIKKAERLMQYHCAAQ